MGIQLEDPSSSHLANSDTLGEGAIILIAIGSVFIILCAASIIYGLHRRRKHVAFTTAGVSTSDKETVQNPTDFMKRLSTWDRCHSVEEILEKRRRSVWTLEVFENYSAGDANQPSES